MSFKCNDKSLFKEYQKISEQMSSIMNIEFTIKPTYELNNNYIKSKIREFRDIITTDFLKNKIPKEKTPYKCLSLIKLESILRIKKIAILRYS